VSANNIRMFSNSLIKKKPIFVLVAELATVSTLGGAK